MTLAGIALPVAAYAAYMAITSALLAHIVVGNAQIQGCWTACGRTPIASGAQRVLAITVNGPSGPVKLYCATTTDRVESGEVAVSAAEVVQFYQEVCSRASSE
jgi:hypothetical protein